MKNGYYEKISDFLNKTNPHRTTDNLSLICVDSIVKDLEDSYPNSSPSEINSWKNSLPHVILELQKLATCNPTILDCFVSIEYRFSILNNRVDFAIVSDNRISIIELKQWNNHYINTINLTTSRLYDKTNPRFQLNPIIQVNNYKRYFETCHSKLSKYENLEIDTIVYLFNSSKNNDIVNKFRTNINIPNCHLCFGHEDDSLFNTLKTFNFESKNVSALIGDIYSGKFLPNISIVDHLAQCVSDNNKYSLDLTEEQTNIFDDIIKNIESNNNSKQIFIVEGRPGTGKTALAIQLLKYGISKGLDNILYNAGTTQQKYLKEQMQSLNIVNNQDDLTIVNHLDNLEEGYDSNSLVICDEAHRIKLHRFEDYLNRSKNMILFIDKFQHLYPSELGNGHNIRNIINNKYKIHEYKIENQFRNNFSNDYLRFVDCIFTKTNCPNRKLCEFDTNNPDYKVFKNICHHIDNNDIDYDFKYFTKYKDFSSSLHNQISNSYKTIRVQGNYYFNNKESENNVIYTPGNRTKLKTDKYDLSLRYKNKPLLSTPDYFDKHKNITYKRIGTASDILGMDSDFVGLYIGKEVNNPLKCSDLSLLKELIIFIYDEFISNSNNNISNKYSYIDSMHYDNIDSLNYQTIKSFLEDLESESPEIYQIYCTYYKQYINNRYSILATRGRKGCYVYLDK